MEKETSKSSKSKKGEESKTLSIVALVLGIAGIVFCWAPFFGLACCLAGVIVGIVAIIKKNNKGMAIGGIVCGALGLIPAILISIATGLLTSFFGGVANDLDQLAKDPDYCKKNPTALVCQTSEDKPTPAPAPEPAPKTYEKIVNDIYDYLKEEDDSMDIVPEDDMKDLIDKLVVCLDDAGVDVSSVDAIEGEADDNEDADACQEKFQDDLYKLVIDNI